jgi:hypothetical protein
MKKQFLVFAVTTLSLAPAFAAENGAPPAAVPSTTGGIVAPKGAKVFFVSPQDGAKVKSKFKVKFGVRDIKLRPAGEDANDHESGHHHLIVDGAAYPSGEVLPSNEKVLHFGKGQTETEVTLPPGTHTLTLQFADGAHRSYGEQMSQTIHITVK